MTRRKQADAPAAPRPQRGQEGEWPFEVDASGQPPLGMSPTEFLRDYWQKRPLLIRNAFPGFISPIAPEDLAGLACEEAALSRLVAHDRTHDRWLLRHGPFEETMFPQLGDHDVDRV